MTFDSAVIRNYRFQYRERYGSDYTGTDDDVRAAIKAIPTLASCEEQDEAVCDYMRDPTQYA